MTDTDIGAVLERHRLQREARKRTMLERHGVESTCRAITWRPATMHLSGWFPDPDVPAEHGVRMRILRGA